MKNQKDSLLEEFQSQVLTAKAVTSIIGGNGTCCSTNATTDGSCLWEYDCRYDGNKDC